MQNLVKDHCFELDESEVFRMMSYPDTARVSQPVLHVAREQIRRVGELADPWGSYVEVPIEKIGDDWVRLDSGGTLRSRRVASLLRRTTSLQVSVVTLGSTVSVEIRRLIAGSCMIEALALDAAATVATNALMGRLRERICTQAEERNCGTTIPYGPGYTGWEIRDLPVLFSCLQAGSLPVHLNEALMMSPEKSLLCVVGIVPGGRRAPRYVVPCCLCDLERCSVRGAPYRGDRQKR